MNYVTILKSCVTHELKCAYIFGKLGVPLIFKIYIMMDGMNNGWGMGYGYGWIIGFIAIVVIVWLAVKRLNRNNNSKPVK